MFITRRSAPFTSTVGAITMLVVACGSESSSQFEEGRDDRGDAVDTDFGTAERRIITDNEDPPPAWCGDAGAPSSRAECPADKNLPGCGCGTLGETAPCWTGYRRNRGRGACKDGVTTCVRRGELGQAWGSCVSEVLPVPNGNGFESCTCFSEGQWQIANTSPCIAQTSGYYAYAAVYDANGQTTNCGSSAPIVPRGTKPSGTWSKSTLELDCPGSFYLCFKIRVGDYENPSPSDCVLGESCISVDYETPGVVQQLPELPTWAGGDPACAQRWAETADSASPGYGEMSVHGRTAQCEQFGDGKSPDYVFHRVQYCPNTCRDSANAQKPECVQCRLASSGVFD